MVKINGVLSVPGDKSISHRALMFSALSRGDVRITGLSPAEDCRSTAACLVKLGMKVSGPQRAARSQVMIAGDLTLTSPGLEGLTAPAETLDAGNSGTTMRIMSGLVAGRHFTSRFDGDDSLRRRPMSRVLTPLSKLGAQVAYEGGADAKPGCAPFSVTGGELRGQTFALEVASAQVQTALLLAGLQAEGVTTVKMPAVARDHTERMLTYIKVPLERHGDGSISVRRLEEPVPPFSLAVPGDLSSAAFFMVAAACLPGSNLLIKSVGVNPGRRLILDVLQDMGAELYQESSGEVCGEPVADLRVCYKGRLKGVTVSGDRMAAGIDEIPILAIAGALCDGEFVIEGAEELRHKESDRLSAIVQNLTAAGVHIEEKSDGFRIEGQERIKGGSTWHTFKDHRLAMSGLIANCIFEEPVKLEETDSIKISYPGFAEHLRMISAE